jgi:hypothetical protein
VFGHDVLWARGFGGPRVSWVRGERQRRQGPRWILFILAVSLVEILDWVGSCYPRAPLLNPGWLLSWNEKRPELRVFGEREWAGVGSKQQKSKQAMSHSGQQRCTAQLQTRHHHPSSAPHTSDIDGSGAPDRDIVFPSRPDSFSLYFTWDIKVCLDRLL